jgi:myo-inositol 2-dehydrogenase/D-chiro-inositol 1-dehydrogenase
MATLALASSRLSLRTAPVGVIQNSRRTPHGYDLRCEVHCERGKLVTEDERETKLWRYDAQGIHGDYYYYFMQRFQDAYRIEVQAFVDGLIGRNAPATQHPRCDRVLARGGGGNQEPARSP